MRTHFLGPFQVRAGFVKHIIGNRFANRYSDCFISFFKHLMRQKHKFNHRLYTKQLPEKEYSIKEVRISSMKMKGYDISFA